MWREGDYKSEEKNAGMSGEGKRGQEVRERERERERQMKEI